jgi:hypothetical protein
MKNEDIKQVLDFDALHDAEKLTGKSYKDDKLTESIGFLNHITHANLKEDMLNQLGDSTLRNTESDYLKIVESIGFETLLIEPFTGSSGTSERMYIMWHDEYSILLKFDTYSYIDDGSWAKSGKEVPPPSINGGSFYYNWSPNNMDNRHANTSSGGMVDNEFGILFNNDFTPHDMAKELRDSEPEYVDGSFDAYIKEQKAWGEEVKQYVTQNNLRYIWSGDHDCREAIKFNINQLNENGEFPKKWQKAPYIYLHHYGDDGYDESITQERLAKLPKHIVERMGL